LELRRSEKVLQAESLKEKESEDDFSIWGSDDEWTNQDQLNHEANYENYWSD
jgi:hypothetical protein